jgi:hypothetical protein
MMDIFGPLCFEIIFCIHHTLKTEVAAYFETLHIQVIHETTALHCITYISTIICELPLKRKVTTLPIILMWF